MAEFSLAQAAYDDLEEIDEYTLRIWGGEQRPRYVAELFHQFELIAENPRSGRPRPDLADGVHSIPLLEHVIFYEVHAGQLYILRVLHQRREPSLAFH